MLGEVVSLVIQLLVEGIVTTTGHGVLLLVTLGRWKLCRDQVGLLTFVGFAFWVGVGLGAIWLFQDRR